jgi:hypothetical protein
MDDVDTVDAAIEPSGLFLLLYTRAGRVRVAWGPRHKSDRVDEGPRSLEKIAEGFLGGTAGGGGRRKADVGVRRGSGDPPQGGASRKQVTRSVAGRALKYSQHAKTGANGRPERPQQAGSLPHLAHHSCQIVAAREDSWR